jgi:aminoglycoside 6'-N-acetyltransferase
VKLRPATAADLPRLQEIRAEPSVARWWAPQDELWSEDDDEVLPFVIDVDGETAGFLELWEENEADFRHAGIDLFLTEAHQGRGVGGEAVRAAIAIAVERGHHRITIDPQASNERAIAAYRKVGFREVGVMRRYCRDAVSREWVDGLLMEFLPDSPA